MRYQNYIFDLYGTLVDIHTDENKASLWKKIAVYFLRVILIVETGKVFGIGSAPWMIKSFFELVGINPVYN